MARHVVAEASALPDGGRLLVEVDGRKIALFNIDGEIHALANSCPHQGGSLLHGYLTGRLTSPCPGDYEYTPKQRYVRCPWHAWEFDLSTGKSFCEPEQMKVRRFDSDIVEGAELVAEVFEVKRDGRYIVIEM